MSAPSISDPRALEREIADAARRNPRAAVARADRLLRRRGGDAEVRARLLRARASALHAGGRFVEASSGYARARTAFLRADLPVEAARCGIGRIDALSQCGRPGAAVAEADRILPVLRGAGAAEAAAMAEANAAGVLLRIDRPAEARRRFRAARATFLERDNTFAVALCDFNLANADALLGDRDDARRRYASAREVFRSRGARSLEAQADYNEGCLAAFEDRASDALALFARALEGFDALDDARHRALVALDRGEVLLRCGLLVEATEDLARAVAGFRRLRLRADGARAQALLGLARGLRGEKAAARSSLAAARRTYAALGSAVGAATADLHAVACGIAVGARAATSLRRAAEVFRNARLPLQRAQALALIGRIADDPRSSRAALRVLRRCPSPVTEFAVLRDLATRSRRTGNRSRTGALHADALAALERVRDGLTADALRLALLGDTEAFLDGCVRFLLEDDAPDAPEKALAVLERARGRALLDLALLGEGDTPEESPDVARLREALRYAYNRLAGFGGTGFRGTPATAGLRRLEGRLARALRSGARAVGALPPEDGAALRRRVPPGTTVVEYFLGDAEGGALLVAAGGVRRCEGLPGRGAAAEMAAALRYEMERAALGEGFAVRHRRRLREDADALLADVRRAFIDPVLDAVGGDRVLLVPHGPLHGLPLGALVPEGGAAVLPGLRFLGPRAVASPETDLLVAPPARGADAVSEEFEALAALLPRAARLDGDAATGEAFLAAAPLAGRIHLATHGLFRADNPLASAFALADRWISAREMLRVRLHASLVVLSACESGAAALAPGAEILGLPRGFLGAGARSVVAALWRVPGAATATFMTAFWGALAAGRDVDVALDAARRDARERGEHPVSWAAFTLFGSGKDVS